MPRKSPAPSQTRIRPSVTRKRAARAATDAHLGIRNLPMPQALHSRPLVSTRACLAVSAVRVPRPAPALLADLARAHTCGMGLGLAGNREVVRLVHSTGPGRKKRAHSRVRDASGARPALPSGESAER